MIRTRRSRLIIVLASVQLANTVYSGVTDSWWHAIVATLITVGLVGFVFLAVEWAFRGEA